MRRWAARGRRPRAPRDPLAVVEVLAVIAMVLSVLGIAGLLADALLGTTLDGGSTPAGTCVEVRGITTGAGVRAASGYPNPRGVGVAATGFRFCIDHPTAVEQAVGVMARLAQFSLVLLAAAIVNRTVRQARRAGFFTDGVADGLRLLGRVLALGALFSPLVAYLAQTYLLHRLHASQSAPYDPNLLLLVTGLGVVAFARILERSVPMREELEATV